MSPKMVLGLAATTVIAVVAAAVTVLTEPGTGHVEVVGEPAFPALRANPDAVESIVIRTAADEVVLERHDETGWRVATAYGYPASSGRVRELVIALADMQLIEAKTADPRRFSRLEVADVAAEDAASRLVRLLDGDDDSLVEVLIGKARNRLTGTEPAGTYIRRVGEQQSWLASGRIDLPGEGALWLDRQVLDVPAEEVVRIEVEPPDGEAYALRRQDDGWSLADAPEKIIEGADPEDLAGALQALAIEAVRPRAEVAWPEAAWRFRFVTAAGLDVSLRLAEIENVAWVEIEASANPDDAEPAAVERAAATSSRTAGWAYRVPERLRERLERPRADWLDDETS